MLPCAHVCQRARAKASAASAAIRAATTGRFVLDASEPDGGTPFPGSGTLLVPAGAPAGGVNSGPSGMTDSATRARVVRCS